MTGWRIALAAGMALLIGVPLLQPLCALHDHAVFAWTADDLHRVSRCLLNTLFLAGATCTLSVTAGTFLAVALFRTALPFTRPLMALLVTTLFVPLSVTVSSWQNILGVRGLLPLASWITEGREWATGWGPAIWVHALAATPWVVCIVGLGLRWVEPELEEEAALSMPPWRVVWHVTLPRCRASIAAAALFVALQTAGEISVTDMMLVPTLAEEVYTQYTLGEDWLGRTFLMSLPGVAVVVAMLALATQRLERTLPPLPSLHRPPRNLTERPPLFVAVLVVVAFALLVVPMGGLVWKVGLAGTPPSWSLLEALARLGKSAMANGGALAITIATAAATGFLVAGLALLCCWLAAGARWLGTLILIVLMTAWVVPAPVIGFCLKALIIALPAGPWLQPLYYSPTPLPIFWVHTIRFLPIAVFFLWPVVRVIPRELFEAAKLEGAGPLGELAFVVWPMTRQAVLVIAIGITALALGEHDAATRVAAPGWTPFVTLLFRAMHYGTDADVAALAILLLGSLVAIASVVMIAWRSLHRQATA